MPRRVRGQITHFAMILQAWDEKSAPSDEKLVQVLKRILHTDRARTGFDKIIPLPKCRTPVVKFTHQPTGMECDISFNTRLVTIYQGATQGVTQTRYTLLTIPMECNSVIRELSLTVRVWVSDPPNLYECVSHTDRERERVLSFPYTDSVY